MICVTLDIETTTPAVLGSDTAPLEPHWPLYDAVDPNSAATMTPVWRLPKPKFPSLPHHTPCVISWLVFDSAPQTFRFNVYRADSGNERESLELLGSDLSKAMRIITWNGRAFDMPLLGLRAMLHKVPWGFWLDKRHRYENYKRMLVHYDLADQLGDQGGARGIGLDDVCQLFGLPGKFDMHGSEVNGMWKKHPDTVVQYCIEDVWHTWLVYLKWVEVFRATEGNRDEIKKWMAQSLRYAWGEKLLQRWVEEFKQRKSKK